MSSKTSQTAKTSSTTSLPTDVATPLSAVGMGFDSWENNVKADEQNAERNEPSARKKLSAYEGGANTNFVGSEGLKKVLVRVSATYQEVAKSLSLL